MKTVEQRMFETFVTTASETELDAKAQVITRVIENPNTPGDIVTTAARWLQIVRDEREARLALRKWASMPRR